MMTSCAIRSIHIYTDFLRLAGARSASMTAQCCSHVAFPPSESCMVASPYRLQSLAPAALRAAAMMAVAIGVGVWSAILLAPRPTESPPLLEVGAAVPTDLSPVVQWFGGAPLRVRVAVHGVIATDAGRGAALLSVEGAPPRAYRVGQSLAPGV